MSLGGGWEWAAPALAGQMEGPLPSAHVLTGPTLGGLLLESPELDPSLVPSLISGCSEHSFKLVAPRMTPQHLHMGYLGGI